MTTLQIKNADRNTRFTTIAVGKIRIYLRDEPAFELMTRKYAGHSAAIRVAVRFYAEHHIDELRRYASLEDDMSPNPSEF
jgi:hypothetical protein